MNKDKIEYLEPSTRRRYQTLWEEFDKFCIDTLQATYPYHTQHVELYVVYLKRYKNISVSHIHLHLSAIASHCKMHDLLDPTKSFGTGALLKAYQKTEKVKRVRLPISEELLNKICHNLGKVVHSKQDKYLFMLIYQFMFWFALRISEVTDTKHNLRSEHVKLDSAKNTLTIHLQSYKFSKGATAKLEIPCDQGSLLRTNYQKYMKTRSTNIEPFFIKKGKPLKRSAVAAVLEKILGHIGEDPKQYGTHSLRIGRGTDLYQKGTAILNMKKFGRWSSNAYTKYIKPASISCT